MRRILAVALALGAAHFSAMAEDTTGWGLRPFIGAGYTWGGDTMQRWTLTPQGSSTDDGYIEDVSAGAGLDLRVGLSYRLGQLPLSVQVSVAHHIDQVSGLTGRGYFRRMPAELVLQWHASDRLRIGMGVRRSLDATLRASGGTCGGSPCVDYRLEMKSSTGVILEGEWMMMPNWGLKARYVHEDYRFKDAPNLIKYEGDHFGLLTNYYFD